MTEAEHRDLSAPTSSRPSSRLTVCDPASTARTLGEIEDLICKGMIRFEQEYMGRGPNRLRAHLIDDLIVVRLEGVLTVAEQQLVRTLPPDKGRDLLKQVRTHLIETARLHLERMILEITAIAVVSLHHDISTATGEEVVLFTLAEAPLMREQKGTGGKRQRE